ncbi:conserved hypothetical protein [uncultured spirochete]|jgi:hypothetical protein|uniref:Uncharacterized protein n=1 Tax=uncultured spirochete TaxID=156406 RepID=A0A3P3XV12_9SPIR|nr:conserved hypothetical protein [uncultured spirochete]
MITTSAEHIRYFGRNSIVLSNEKVRAVIDDLGGMVPEFSLRKGRGAINAHWIPDFRGNSGQPWDAATHAPYWKGKILYILAGDFPCSPSFGPDCTVDGTKLPAHGWTANERWAMSSSGILADENVAYAIFSLQSPDRSMPLSYKKYDVVQKDHPVHYSVISIRNHGGSPIAINIAHHNTTGAPFLQAGCRIYVSAQKFLTPPLHTEFDDTGRLAVGAEFDSLYRAPSRNGKLIDLSVVPGMIGFTDFVTGAVPKDARLGWSCVVNPVLRLAYVTFFPGPRDIPEKDIPLGFNDLWMQYGGRNFTPWALSEGGADRTFCLGTENAVGAFANGLEYSRANPILLDSPTIVSIPAGEERNLFYGTALIELDDSLASEAILNIEAEDDALVLKTTKSSQRILLDGSFSSLRVLIRALSGK